MAPALRELLRARYGRREVLKGAAALAALGATLAPGVLGAVTAQPAVAGFHFPEVARGRDETHHVAAGHRADVLIRWGDPVLPGAPAFDPLKQSAAAQALQFGYNNDFIGFAPLPLGSGNPDHGLLCINHEATVRPLMFPGLRSLAYPWSTRDKVDIEMAALGGSVVEVRKGGDGRWALVADSPFNRRITASGTEMRLSGPAAGHPRLGTSADPGGTRVLGTFADCGGGMTPWGTWLMAEEHFPYHFQGRLSGHPEQRNYQRYGLAPGYYAWGRYHDRFDVNKEANEANRFGWIVEVDPYDPQSTPIKRTALGRLRHEAAETIVNGDGRLVVYSGDDQQFEYLYRFVSDDPVSLGDRAANRDLLDRGTLSVARFEAGGALQWLPLVHGTGPLTATNGFDSQADVLIEPRRAADLLGATPMDRPEDIEPNPRTGKVYVALTKNPARSRQETDAANPRGPNPYGHILELSPPGGDHGAASYGWDVLVLCGDPGDPAAGARWNPATSANGWFIAPDNFAIDGRGRLWVTSDHRPGAAGGSNGLWALATEGALRGTGRLFFRTPVGGAATGPRFAPDDRSLFIAVQNPGRAGILSLLGLPFGSTFDDPATRWPDFDPSMPPRPSVVAVVRDDGGPIGA